MEFAGNLVPVLKSGEQLQLPFRAFKENRIPFTARIKDPDAADMMGRIMFMSEPKVPKGEPSQTPICTLNILLPDKISPATGASSELDLLELSKNYSFLRDGGISEFCFFILNKHMFLKFQWKLMTDFNYLFRSTRHDSSSDYSPHRHCQFARQGLGTSCRGTQHISKGD